MRCTWMSFNLHSMPHTAPSIDILWNNFYYAILFTPASSSTQSLNLRSFWQVVLFLQHFESRTLIYNHTYMSFTTERLMPHCVYLLYIEYFSMKCDLKLWKWFLCFLVIHYSRIWNYTFYFRLYVKNRDFASSAIGNNGRNAIQYQLSKC